MNRMKHYIILCLALIFTACQESVTPSEVVEAPPTLFPDYAEVTIPTTIAPLNFRVETEYEKIDALIEGSRSGSIHVQQSQVIDIPSREWKRLLEDNAEGSLKLTISIKQSGEWIQYKPFSIYISPYSIDYGLVYRLIAPGYEVYSKMGIYQRNLSDFRQTALLENTLLPGNCINCHSFCVGNPEQMSLHLRGELGGTILMADGQTDIYNTKTDQTIGNCVYPYWHPSGKYIAYSVNETRQVFHERKDERVEVVDAQSDMVVYNRETNELLSCPQLQSKDAFETFPSFSPDGRWLYFCSSEAHPIPEAYEQVKYSLCRIPFDPANGTFGEQVDTLVSAKALDKSVSFPRPSYDGRYIMYVLSDYGNFSIWHKEANLWLLDLQTNETRELVEINSNNVDSYHSWSTNSHWFVFSSRRLDGLYTRPYLASIDDTGHISKPFLLPQKDPGLYDTSLYSFNIPEFVTGSVHFNTREVEKKAISPNRIQMKFKWQH
ncbi:cytochrome c-binding protein [Bacteroidia bacterium]|nr:cytochrome c-binding protein [Bacteroidia bacterium]